MTDNNNYCIVDRVHELEDGIRMALKALGHVEDEAAIECNRILECTLERGQDEQRNSAGEQVARSINQITADAWMRGKANERAGKQTKKQQIAEPCRDVDKLKAELLRHREMINRAYKLSTGYSIGWPEDAPNKWVPPVPFTCEVDNHEQ